MLHYGQVSFRYLPFPMGVAKRIFDPRDYDELTATFPDPEVFIHEPGLGNRYALTRFNNRGAYRAAINSQPVWRELHRWISTREFLDQTLEMLVAHHIDLVRERGVSSLTHRLKTFARGLRRGSLCGNRRRLHTELVFAALPADGGFLLPHTDSPAKLVNMALAMSRPGDWDPAFGGSTDIDWPLDERRSFNRNNQRLNFDQVRLVDSIPFAPNQGIIVIKTYNSWHSVRPMSGKASKAMRRTANINILHE